MHDCEDNFGDLYFKALKLYGKVNCIPVSATFELTPLCNFNCPMCYVHRQKDEETVSQMMTAEQWLDLAGQAKELGTLRLTLTGGEIFTYPEFWELYSELNKMGFLISLLSNGYLIDEKVKENFIKYGMPHSMKLSLYGASNETYEKMCGVKNGLDRFSKAVDILKELKIPFEVTSTIIKDNFDDLEKMYAFAKEKIFKFSHTYAVVATNRASNQNVKNNRLFMTDFADLFSIKTVEKYKHPPMKNPWDICGRYRNSVWICWDGRIRSCSFATEPAVSVKEKTLQEAWKELNEKMDKIKFPVECESCEAKEFCRSCPGVRNAETESYEKIVESSCEESRKLYSIYKKLSKESNEV